MSNPGVLRASVARYARPLITSLEIEWYSETQNGVKACSFKYFVDWDWGDGYRKLRLWVVALRYERSYL